MSQSNTIDITLKNLLEQINNPGTITKDNFKNFVESEVEKTNILLEKQLLYICSSIIRTEEVFINETVSDPYYKNNETEFVCSTDAIKEDIYNLTLPTFLGYLGKKFKFYNTGSYDIILKDENILVEVCASVSKSKEKEHLTRFKHKRTTNNWIVHGITVDDITQTQSLTIPTRKYVNFIYYFHDINLTKKKFIYRFADSKQNNEITIDCSNKRKREDEVKDKVEKGREEGREEVREEWAIDLIYEDYDIDYISNRTKLAKEKIQDLEEKELLEYLRRLEETEE